MTIQRTTRFLVVALMLVMGAGLVSCGNDESADTGDTQTAGNTSGNGSTDTNEDKGDVGGDNGRAFDSTDETVVTALRAALDVKDVKFEGDTVRLIMSKGSTEKATAWIPCGAASAVLAENENPILVYSDGELDCSKRYDE